MAADRGRGLESSEWATDGKAHMPPSPLSLPAVPWLTVGRLWPHPGWGWIEDHGEEWSVLRIEMVIWARPVFLSVEIQQWEDLRSHLIGDESGGEWWHRLNLDHRSIFIKRRLQYEKQAVIAFELSSYFGERSSVGLFSLKRNLIQGLFSPSGSTFSAPRRKMPDKGSVWPTVRVRL